jgi:oligopeptide/dipeptide ABC transporter ATP-binding protein
MPELDSDKRLQPIAGEVPSVGMIPQGCPFATRCDKVCKECFAEKPPIKEIANGRIACFNYYD